MTLNVRSVVLAQPIFKAAGFVAAAVLLALTAEAQARAQAQSSRYEGRSVADVLQELQTVTELRIIFSSDLVPPTLRVTVEPKSSDPRQLVLEILDPHDLTLRKGPGDTLLVVALPTTVPPKPHRREAPPEVRNIQARTEARTPDEMRIEEQVEVTDQLAHERGRSGGYALEPSAIRETAGGFENVLQVLPVLPGIAATNDEDGRLAVRGAGPEHNLVVLDGVQVHNPYRFSELASSFLNPATAARVTLDASGLDAGYGGRLSSVTVIETRDGTRDRKLAISGSLGVASGDVLLEGRLPKTESGSWWATARGTYYRPFVDFFRSGVLPNFGDLQFKVSLRPSRRTRLSLFGLVGRESTHIPERDEDGTETTGARFRGDNRLALLNLSWIPGARFVTTTTVSASTNDARDIDTFSYEAAMDPFERVVGVRDIAARQRAVYEVSSGHVLDAGVELHRLGSSWRMAGVKPPIFWRGLGPSTWGERIEYPPEGAIESRLARTHVGVWLQDRVLIGSRVALEPGVRVDWNSFTRGSSWQPRLRVTGRVGGTAVWAGFAAQAQTRRMRACRGSTTFTSRKRITSTCATSDPSRSSPDSSVRWAQVSTSASRRTAAASIGCSCSDWRPTSSVRSGSRRIPFPQTYRPTVQSSNTGPRYFRKAPAAAPRAASKCSCDAPDGG
jgi:hypothetical protein